MPTNPVFILGVVSLIWGLTWIAIKAGVQTIPPFFFAGTRFIFAGILIGLLFYRQSLWATLNDRKIKLILLAFLMVTGCYGALFWALQTLPSGLAGVINLSVVPLGLLAFGAMLGAESLTRSKIVAVVVGCGGLGVLFLPDLLIGESYHAGGIAVIFAGTLCACLGSVLSRRWFADVPVATLSAGTMTLGGFGLIVISFAVEPLTLETLESFGNWEILLSWLFLVLAGSLGAFTLYFHLVRVWGPSRSGLYAFISPVVAILAGVLVYGEMLDPLQVAGCVILISAAAIAIFEGIAEQRTERAKSTFVLSRARSRSDAGKPKADR